jgi:hypothetical protein
MEVFMSRFDDYDYDDYDDYDEMTAPVSGSAPVARSPLALFAPSASSRGSSLSGRGNSFEEGDVGFPDKAYARVTPSPVLFRSAAICIQPSQYSQHIDRLEAECVELKREAEALSPVWEASKDYTAPFPVSPDSLDQLKRIKEIPIKYQELEAKIKELHGLHLSAIRSVKEKKGAEPEPESTPPRFRVGRPPI